MAAVVLFTCRDIFLPEESMSAVFTTHRMLCAMHFLWAKQWGPSVFLSALKERGIFKSRLSILKYLTSVFPPPCIVAVLLCATLSGPCA